MKRYYFFLLLLLFGCTTAPEMNIQKVEIKSPLIIDSEKKAKTFQLQKVIVGLKKGETIGTRETSFFGACGMGRQIKWDGGSDISNDQFFETFFNEFKKAGYPVLGNPKEIFPNSNSPFPDLLVGAKIIEYKIDTCATHSSNFQRYTSTVFLKTLWQFYSYVDQKIVHEITTVGGIIDHEGLPSDAFSQAFTANIKNLIGDKEFFEFITTTKDPTASLFLGRNKSLL